MKNGTIVNSAMHIVKGLLLNTFDVVLFLSFLVTTVGSRKRRYTGIRIKNLLL